MSLESYRIAGTCEHFLPSQMYPITIEKLKDFTDQEDRDPTLIKARREADRFLILPENIVSAACYG